jgi:hypothetical protein
MSATLMYALPSSGTVAGAGGGDPPKDNDGKKRVPDTKLCFKEDEDHKIGQRITMKWIFSDAVGMESMCTIN